jgi:ATP-dependent DNA helicase RecG
MSSVDVARVLAMTPQQLGVGLRDLPEDQWFDRKHPRIQARELADVVMGFANAEGGTIAIGVHGGKVLGVDGAPPAIRNSWRQAALDFIVPPVRVEFREHPCTNVVGDADHVLVLHIEATGQVHANVRDEVLLRVGDENRKLTFQQRRELLFEKGQATFEIGIVEGATEADLDPALVATYAEAVRASDSSRLLQARGLLSQRSEVTAAGMLLFGRAPQRFFPEAYVRVLRYRGSSKGSGTRQQLLEDHRCEGPIPEQLGTAMAVISQVLPTRRALGSTGKFERLGIVPRDAWLEGVVNAVVHRSYGVFGDHVRVSVFDDRVEVESPGRFPGLVDLSRPETIGRFARNPRIARVCADLHFGQELGEGVRRIFEEMRLAGLVAPVYTQTAGSVLLQLHAEAVDPELERRLPEMARELVRVIRDLGRPSTGDLIAETGLTRPTLLARLRALRDAGVVEWVGHSRKDPRAYWRLRNDG